MVESRFASETGKDGASLGVGEGSGITLRRCQIGRDLAVHAHFLLSPQSLRSSQTKSLSIREQTTEVGSETSAQAHKVLLSLYK